MDSDENHISEFWEWQGGEYSFQKYSGNDISPFLWDEVNQKEDSLFYMLVDQTPIKECTEFGYPTLNTTVDFELDDTNKASEDCRELSLLKRRRMLQYESSDVDITIKNGEVSPAIVQSKAVEGSHIDNDLQDSVQCAYGFSDNSYVTGCESLDQSSDKCLLNHYGDIDVNIWCAEMMSCEVSGSQIDVTDYCSISHEIGSDEVPKHTTASPQIRFKGNKSLIKPPTKLAATVTYPFALIKPSGVQGDMTLNDINRRIHSPSPPDKQHIKEWHHGHVLCYPTSAFSGKPVVAKTMIRTEGGKGSIIITRTKG